MGMFDQIVCKYLLPASFSWANKLTYQTKDTPSQFMDDYEIREDGTLWVEDFRIEDRSAATKWLVENPDKTDDDLPEELGGWKGMIGVMTRVPLGWKRVENFVTGEIRFYNTLGSDHSGWIEWSAYFEEGRAVRINLVEYRKPKGSE